MYTPAGAFKDRTSQVHEERVLKHNYASLHLACIDATNPAQAHAPAGAGDRDLNDDIGVGREEYGAKGAGAPPALHGIGARAAALKPGLAHTLHACWGWVSAGFRGQAWDRVVSWWGGGV